MYAKIQDVGSHSASFKGEQDFNNIKWQPIQSNQSCNNLQLSHGFDIINFPFAIATTLMKDQVFLINVNTG